MRSLRLCRKDNCLIFGGEDDQLATLEDVHEYSDNSIELLKSIPDCTLVRLQDGCMTAQRLSGDYDNQDCSCVENTKELWLADYNNEYDGLRHFII